MESAGGTPLVVVSFWSGNSRAICRCKTLPPVTVGLTITGVAAGMVASGTPETSVELEPLHAPVPVFQVPPRRAR